MEGAVPAPPEGGQVVGELNLKGDHTSQGPG